jgi:hypothetical protein
VAFQLLNARLSEQADNIELAEEQLWELYAQYQGTSWTGKIEYPESFAIRDTDNELDQLIKVYNTIDNPATKTAVANQITDLMELEVEAEMSHPTLTVDTMMPHIQQMVMEGYSDQGILDLHPEVTSADIARAKNQLLTEEN